MSAAANAPASAVFPPGTQVGGYRILSPLGDGGMGQVYLAQEDALERQVALKVLPPQDADAEGRARFLREAKALARVQHENVVRVFTSGTDPDVLGQEVAWMALEYVPGQPLDALLQQGVLDEAFALDLAVQAARGLAAVHREGIVHRDVKPANLLLDDDGVLVVLDFGVALLSDASSTGGFVTMAGVAVGTPHYMAPEQARGQTLDARVDAWGLGATLFHMLAGTPPFFADGSVDGGQSDLDILTRSLHQAAPDVRSKAPNISASTANLIATLLQADALLRPGDLDTVADSLEDLAEQVLSAPVVEPTVPDNDDVLEAPVPAKLSTSKPLVASTTRAKQQLEQQLEQQAAQPSVSRVQKVVLSVAGVLLIAGLWLATLILIPDSPLPPSPASDSHVSTTAPKTPTSRPPTLPLRLNPPRPAVPVQAPPPSTATLVEAITKGDAQAIETLQERKTLESRQALEKLVLQGGVKSIEVLNVLKIRAPKTYFSLLKKALFEGPAPLQKMALARVTAIRNVAAIQTLNRVAAEHPDPILRQAALKARRQLFVVDGE